MHQLTLTLSLIFLIAVRPMESEELKLPVQGAPAALFSLELVDGGQVPAPPGQSAGAPKFSLIVIEGEGAINNIKQRTAREVIVEVDDSNHKPVAGVVVTFFAMDQPGAAGGTFAGGSHLATAISDANGRAVARGFEANAVAGNVSIEVTASYLDSVVAKTFVHETNSLTAASTATSGSVAATATGLSHAAIIGIVVAGVCVAVGVGVWLGTRSSGQTGTVGAGTVTVTAP